MLSTTEPWGKDWVQAGAAEARAPRGCPCSISTAAGQAGFGNGCPKTQQLEAEAEEVA